MSTFPLIGVSMSITVKTSPERAFVNSTYLNAIQQAGGVPVALPAQLSPRSWERLAARLEGILLTGGGDIDPTLFGETPHPTLSDVSPMRDTFEATAARWALEHGVPLLCVCRGLQVLNVALGGSLYQDVGTEPGTQLEHSQKGPRDEPTHKVKVTPGSRLAEVMGADEVEVNSMHHQAIKTLGRGLTASAWAPDQLVEGVELPTSDSFVLGVQWHPEGLIEHSDPARRLFSALVTHAAAARARK